MTVLLRYVLVGLFAAALLGTPRSANAEESKSVALIIDPYSTRTAMR